MIITVFSHNFTVTGHDNRGYHVLKEFMANFIEYERPRGNPNGNYWNMAPVKPEVMHIYVSVTANRREFRFHINTLEDFKELLDSRGISYEIEVMDFYDPPYVEQKVLDKYVPRDDQVPYLNYVAEPGVTKILNLPTGFGKTMISLTGAAKHNARMVVSIEPKFFHLWREALEGSKQVLDVDIDTEVAFIKGTKDFVKLLKLALAGGIDHIKVIVVSSSTVINFIRSYEKFNGNLDGVYPIDPIELYSTLGAIRLKDEVHLGIYANFSEELHLHCPLSINMSATLKDGGFKDSIVDIMFPKEWQPTTEVSREPYIDCYALMYNFQNPGQIRTTRRGSSDYSHMAYEEFILKDKKLTANYFKLIAHWVENEYINQKVSTQRACIFVSSVDMATQLTKYLDNRFLHISFARYAASTGDNYEEAKQKNVLITTVQSFGTGFDLDDLLCALLTTALQAPKTNEQVLGRLRQLKKFPGTNPRFYYFVCLDIPKHINYHKNKEILFIGKVRNSYNRYMNITI